MDICPMCGSWFQTRSALKKHIRLHPLEKRVRFAYMDKENRSMFFTSAEWPGAQGLLAEEERKMRAEYAP